MSEYEILPVDAYEDLPSDPNDQFAKLVTIAQANVTRLMDLANSNEFATELRGQFIFTVSSIADALGIEGLPDVAPGRLDYEDYVQFQVYLAGVLARVRLQSKTIPRPHSVELGRVTRAKIEVQLNKLRQYINDSDLPEPRKASLLAKIAKLEAELQKQRVGFGRVMEVLTAVSVLAGGGTAFLANANGASETILSILTWVGEDKEKEEEERLRLAPPPKQLPDYSKPKPAATAGWSNATDDLDDDIPF